eukprot:888893-Amphidinium_carterae.1
MARRISQHLWLAAVQLQLATADFAGSLGIETLGAFERKLAALVSELTCDAYMSQSACSVLMLLQLAHAQVKMGNGQCNGGVGGHGNHYCLHGGACNEGGLPVHM